MVIGTLPVGLLQRLYYIVVKGVINKAIGQPGIDGIGSIQTSTGQPHE